MTDRFDVAIIGAGAAGMFCAGVAAQRGARVVLLDHAQRIGEKIRISGGGRCNFTNLQADRLERYAGEQPGFARHALRGYPPSRFIELVRSYRIEFHEKHKGQLFCDGSSEQIIQMLSAETLRAQVQWRTGCSVHEVALEHLRTNNAGSALHQFSLDTDSGRIRTGALVIATGGLSIPKIGASDFGLRLARRFGLAITEPRPALVPLVFDAQQWQPFAKLAGVALPVSISTPARPQAPVFDEDLLFTHRGLSGPAMLQVSTFWRPGEPVRIDLAPATGLDQLLESARSAGRQQLGAVLAKGMPRRLAQQWLEHLAQADPRLSPVARVAELGKRELRSLSDSLHGWQVKPSGSEGYRKAEVTAGGVDTRGIDPRTMQSRAVSGLYFIGEVVDVTGWLGGYNFQWAWASAHAAAQALTARLATA
ncbi:MAG: NAD(P)/FAD-dependent oxidoreductase [Quisquiliibacterium sp.]